MKNRYAVRARITERQFREIARLFAVDLAATKIAALSGLNRNTVNRYLRGIRERIADYCESLSPLPASTNLHCLSSGAGREPGAFGKTAVIGVVRHDGCTFTEIVPKSSEPALQAFLRGRIPLASVIASEGWRGYHGLVDVGPGRHLRVNTPGDEVAGGKNPINDIEGFWGFAKPRLQRMRGMDRRLFYLHLKECEFRFNFRKQDLYQLVLKLCRTRPLN